MHPPSPPSPRRSPQTIYSPTTKPSEAMAIPGAAPTLVAPPPPLPPPANVEELGVTHDHAWPFNNNPNWQGFGSFGKPDFTGFDRPRLQSFMDPRDKDPFRRDSTFTVVPAGRHGSDRDGQKSRTPSDGDVVPPVSPGYRLQSERQLEKSSLDTSSQQYDRNLLSKIGGPNTPLRMPSFSSSTSDVPAVSPGGQHDARGPAFKRLSIPERRQSSNDSRFSSRNNSTVSSVFTPTAFRSNSIFQDPSEARAQYLKRHPSLLFDEPPSHRGSYDSNVLPSPMEEGPMRDLCLSDRSPGDDSEARPGMKRRASSPHDAMRSERSSVSSVPGYLDGPRRSIHQYPPRNSIANRLNYPNHSSISSASSMSNRTASMASSRLSIASSVTSFGSNLLNPNTLSALPPGMEGETSPYPMSKSLNPSPRSSFCPPPFSRHSVDQSAMRNGQDQSARGSIDQSSRQSMEQTDRQIAPPPTSHPASHEPYQHHQGPQGVLICDCCPKKPKKFATEEDLRLHHMEKQYTCMYCPNRFKNKNEAERHQNSLHLRMHSWSCAALPSVEAAFHPHTATTDACGYCGEEFRNNPADWTVRRAHLGIVHKYGECNQMKKFFRADHFRQHLKHSHAGTSGKWTNILENACMRDEPPPVPIRGSGGERENGFVGGQQQQQQQQQTIDEER